MPAATFSMGLPLHIYDDKEAIVDDDRDMRNTFAKITVRLQSSFGIDILQLLGTFGKLIVGSQEVLQRNYKRFCRSFAEVLQRYDQELLQRYKTCSS